MKTQTIKKILKRKLIGTNSEIYGECDIELFGGGSGRTHKTMLLDKVVEKVKLSYLKGTRSTMDSTLG